MRMVICDFDGTLIDAHSFPMWVWYVIKRSFAKGDVSIFFRFASALLMRKLGLITVPQFKTYLMSQHYSSDYDDGFVESLKSHVNFKLIERLRELDAFLVLSSAAPLSYLQHVSGRFGVRFDKVLGSHVHGNVLFDNYARNKVLAIEGFLDACESIILFTDHHVDLPLMKISDEVFLVNPSARTVWKLNSAGVDYKLFEN